MNYFFSRVQDFSSYIYIFNILQQNVTWIFDVIKKSLKPGHTIVFMSSDQQANGPL